MRDSLAYLSQGEFLTSALFCSAAQESALSPETVSGLLC